MGKMQRFIEETIKNARTILSDEARKAPKRKSSIRRLSPKVRFAKKYQSLPHGDRDKVVNLFYKFGELSKRNDPLTEFAPFWGNYYKVYDSIRPDIEADDRKRELFHESAHRIADMSGSTRPLRIVFIPQSQFWKRLVGIPNDSIALWIKSLSHVEVEEEKTTKDSRLEDYIEISNRVLTNYHNSFDNVFRLFGERKALYGLEEMLFGLAKSRELDGKGVREHFRVLRKIPTDSRKTIEYARHKLKVKKTESDELLYDIFSVSGRTKSSRDALSNTIQLVAAFSQDDANGEREILRTIRDITVKDCNFMREISNDVGSIATFGDRIGKAIVRTYLGVLKNIVELPKISSEDRQTYCEFTRRMFEEYFRTEKVGASMKPAEIFSEEEIKERCVSYINRSFSLDGESRNVALDLMRLSMRNLRRAYRLSSYSPSMYLDEVSDIILRAVESNKDKAREFMVRLCNLIASTEQEETMVTERAEIKVQKYVNPVLRAVPELMHRMEIGDWERVLSVISKKQDRCANEQMHAAASLFVDDFLETLRRLDRELIPYCLDEVSRTGSGDLRGSVDLESLIVRSVSERIGEFSQDDLSNMHSILFRIYSDGAGYFAGAPAVFDEFATDIGEIPEKFRSRAIEYAERLLDHNFKYPREHSAIREKARLLVKYSKGLRQNIGFLEDRFVNWIEQGLRQNRTVDSFIEFLENKHGYFSEELDNAAGGLPLSDVSGRLLAYVQALTGRAIKIEGSPSVGLVCSFQGDTFFLPQTVNTGRDESENFGIFKALASYQAGAIMHGAYDIDTSELEPEIRKRFGLDGRVSNFFNSFENPVFARNLFELLEFARIDAKLEEKFPGLIRDLRTFKEVLVNTTASSNGSKASTLRNIRDYICGATVSGKFDSGLESILESEIGNVRRQDSSVGSSIGAVRRIYEKADKIIDLSQEDSLASFIELDVEEVTNDKRDASYLTAKPANGFPLGNRFRYDEWDFSKGTYKEGFAQVVQIPYPIQAENDYVLNVMQNEGMAIQRLKQIFETLKPEELEKVKRQLSGDVDYDALVQARAEQRSGITPSEKIYVREFKNLRSVVSMVLSEGSGSLKRFLDLEKPDLRVIDIIKRAKIYFSEALDSIGDDFALATFSGETEKNVEFYLLKDFGQFYDDGVRRTIGSLQPLKQNRDGAGIRHGTHLLSQQPEKTKLLFYLMDGFPHDFSYSGEYAIEDTKRAVIESKHQGCVPIVFAFGPRINEGIRSLAEHCIYREVADPRAVPELLPRLYRGMTL